MMRTPNLSKAIERSEAELASLCQDLIRVKSTSGHEDKIADYIVRKMKELEYDEVQKDKVGNVVGVVGGGSPTLLFNAHMDTVSEGELSNWATDPFEGEIRNGVIHGRGASDMKGALASMILAGGLLKKAAHPEGRLVLACVVHEEDFEGFGVRHVIENFGSPDYVVLGEATDLQVAIGHRGRTEVELEAYGRTAHGSAPEKGVNAINLMVSLIQKIEQGASQLPAHPFLGKASVSVNGISCSPNETAIVPDKCRAILDRRIVPGERRQSILNEYKYYIKSLKSKNKGASYSVAIASRELTCYTGYKEKVDYFFPAWMTEKDEALVLKAKNAVESAVRRRIRLTRWLFSTDGVYTAGTLGIPTIGFGPGEERYAHTPNDQIDMPDMVRSLKGYCSIALSLI